MGSSNLRALLAIAAIFVAAIATYAAFRRGSSESGEGVVTREQLPTGLFLDVPPKEVADIAPTKKNAKVGDSVTVRGRIGGSRKPFVEGRGVFLVMDRNVPNCTENHNPGCPSPWDFCCAPKEARLAGAATIEVAGPAGVPVRSGLMGVGGLAPLREVVVEGTVAELTEGGGMVIRAQHLFVAGS